MVNLKIHDVTSWFSNNSDTHIAQYLTKKKATSNEIWSINRTREIFFFKSYAENEAGRLVPDLFLFFKKLNTR